MTKLAEVALYQQITDAEALRHILEEGLDEDILPTEELKPVLSWALDYYIANGLKKAPSIPVVLDTFEDLLADHGIDMEEDPDGTVEWAIEKLKSTYAYRQANTLAKDLVTTVADQPDHIDRVAAFGAMASRITAVANSMESRVYRVEARDGFPSSLREFEARALSREEIRGMRFGLPDIDAHTHGIHQGELAILAAPPKTGKSYFVDQVALNDWLAGRNVALCTLENSIQMTYDRIACLATGVDPSKWQRGICTPDEVEAVRQWSADLQRLDQTFWVLQPPLGRQDFDSMVAEARVREAETLIIDQLTFVEMDTSSHKNKSERIGDGLHRLKKLISGGRDPIATLLAHQINREGVKAADKLGYLEMHHLADSSEVERTADWVFGMYASRDEQRSARARFQTLASRREIIKHWSLIWDIKGGNIVTEREIALG